jgi:hypothetical protein
MSHQYDNRKVYLAAKAALSDPALGLNVKNAVLSQSTLRLEVLAAVNTTIYKFGVLVNDQSNGQQPSPTEVRLNLQDAFYAASMQVLIGLKQTPADTAWPVHSYPNPAVFTTSGAAVALYNLYNGQLNLTVNNKIITPSWDILRHYKSNQTQGTGATQATGPVDQFDGGLDAGFPVEPNLVLIGSKNNVLQINLPAAIGVLQATPSTAQTPIVIIFRGVLAQNVTVVS